MKNYRLTFLALCLLAATQLAPAQERKFGIGLIIGEPTGLSAKYWMSGGTALDFGLGTELFGEDNGFHFHMDYLWHSFSTIKSTERFPVYYGVGGSVGSGGGSSFAVRGVAGIAWISDKSPIDIFLEIVPALRISPSADLVFQGGAGIRYYF